VKHVVYVEESSILRETLSAALEINGFRATTCGDARSAWNTIVEEGCDLLLLDIELRKGTGMALLKKVRSSQSTRTLPVVLLTGCTNPETIRQAVACRPRKLLVKSNFSLERLLEVIKESTDPNATPAAPAPAAPAAAAPAATAAAAPSAAAAPAPAAASAAAAAPAAGAPAAPTPPPAPAAAPPAKVEAPLSRAQIEQMEPMMSRRETAGFIASTKPLEHPIAATARAIRAALALTGTDAQVVGALVQDDALCARVGAIAAADRGDGAPPPEAAAAIVGHYGADRIREALMVACVFERFGGVGEDLVPPGPFWCHVLTVARLARDLAASRDDVSPTQAFAAGLLHDLGRLVLAENVRPAYAPLTSLAKRACMPLELLEVRMLGLSHADVVAELVDGWIFGRDLGPVLRLHHGSRQELEQLDRDDVPMALVLAFADRLAHAHLAGDPRHDRVAATEELARALHLDASHADRAGDGIAAWTAAVTAAATDGAIQPESAEQVLREALGDGPIRPLMLPRDAMGDATRVCIRRMLAASGRAAPALVADDDAAAMADAPPPNLAILRLRGKLDARGEIARLRELEPFPDHAPLPVLILADDAAAANIAELTDRRVDVLELPVRAGEIAERMAELAIPDEDIGAAARTAA
jgi:DNA-binding NarL/FixJ family response regulator